VEQDAPTTSQHQFRALVIINLSMKNGVIPHIFHLDSLTIYGFEHIEESFQVNWNCMLTHVEKQVLQVEHGR
jgi:hypothetical protein